MNRGRMLLRVLGSVLLLSLGTALRAQLNRGVMEGVVTDPQGAVAPGVDVSVTVVETNVAVSRKTNSSGYYRVVDLVHQAGCTFGRITNIQTDPRSMEFALKFYW